MLIFAIQQITVEGISLAWPAILDTSREYYLNAVALTAVVRPYSRQFIKDNAWMSEPKSPVQQEQERSKADGSNIRADQRPTEDKSAIIGPSEAGSDSELVFALVGAVGTELDKVVKVLVERLRVYRYTATEVRISSKVIPELVKREPSEIPLPEYDRISHGMDDGDTARLQSKNNAILALGAASSIATLRKKSGQGDGQYAPRRAYIINSLKHPDEVLALRKIYPLGFYLIGVHSEEKRRRDFLVYDRRMTQEQADLLINRDQEEADRWGQQVRKTFHLSDVFVRLTSDQDEFKNHLWRFLEILFGHPYRTPTFDEYAMFLAFVSSLRSADLSRQVGAVIARDREILATGANDCPKAGGGLYWPEYNPATKKIEDVEGGRDYTRRVDVNKAEQTSIIDQIVKKASEKEIDGATIRKILEDSRIQDLTEFGRMVHAEMEALLACARNGVSCRNATLFTTTFPCHNCAKHIIAAGIKKVVYIQPYQKSKAEEFHPDALYLGFDAGTSGSTLVQCRPFVGLGPRRFLDLFSMDLGAGYALVRKDKTTAKTVQWNEESAQLRLQMLPASYSELESSASNNFKQHTNPH